MKYLLTLLGFITLAVSPMHATRPNLLIDQERVDELVQAIALPDSVHREIFTAMKLDVDANAASIISGGDRVSSIWNYNRSFLATRAAMLFAVTGEGVYSKIAYDALWAVHNDPDPSNRLPDSGYGLARATVGNGFAIAYDLCYDGWTESQRNYVRGRIMDALNAWPSYSHANLNASHRGSNWVAVCRGSELMLMLAVEEQNNRSARYASLKGWLNTHLSHYGSRGWNQEGNYYMTYSLKFLLSAAIALRNNGDTTLEAALTGSRNLHHIAMYGGMFNAAQSSVQWGVGGDGFGAEGWNSLLFGIIPEAELPYYKWFYDRYRGPLNPALPAAKYDNGAAGDVFALMFYPEAVAAVDPATAMPIGVTDDRGGYFFRNRWQDADDLIVYLGADTSSHDNAWNEADALQIHLLGFGSKFTGGTGSSGLVNLFNQVLVNGQARTGTEGTGALEFFQLNGRQGYAIANGGSKYAALGVTTAKRHLMVDFAEGDHPVAIVSTFDDIQSTVTNSYTWQLNNLGLSTFSSTESGIPTFTIHGDGDAYLKGWLMGTAGITVSTDGSLKGDVTAGNLKLWVVMAIGKGSAPMAVINGSGLMTELQIGDRLVQYNSMANRIESSTSSAFPIASFDVDQKLGVSPVTVNFDASGSTSPDGEPLNYSWDFGDGSTATGMVVSHTFAPKGNYSVQLTVTDSSLQTAQAGRVIRVTNTPPFATFTVTPDSGNLPLQVSFDGNSSTDANGHSLSYHWDFGDGNSATGAVVNHTYVTQGVFYPVLTVSDGHGDSAIAVRVVYAGNQPPVAVINATHDRGLPPLLVQFDATGSNDPEEDPLTYAWDFGDGQSGIGISPSHTYLDFGVYTAQLTVSDNHGNSTVATTVVRVENMPPSAAFSMSAVSGNAPINVSFNGSASIDPEGEALLYHWDFGDGSTANGIAPQHTYSAHGNYRVTLTVTDIHGASGIATREISALDSLGMRAPDQPAEVTPGLVYDYYSGSFGASLPNFQQMRPAFSGVTPNVNFLSRVANVGYAYRFSGFIWIPEDGVYKFHFRSRDTMWLQIGSQTVINSTQRSLGSPLSGFGSIALKAGFHRFTAGHHYAEVFAPDWVGILEFNWELPGSPGVVRGIPDEYFFHQPGRPDANIEVSPAPGNHIPPVTVNFIESTLPGVYKFYATSSGQSLDLSFSAEGSFSPNGSITTCIWTFPGNITAGGFTTSRKLPVGTHAVTLTVIDETGAMVTSGVTIQVLNPPAKLNRSREFGKTIIAESDSDIGPAGNAFDDRLDTRWLAWAEESWIEIHFDHNDGRQAYVIDEYTVTNTPSWNDRDPQEILFRASNDGVNWVVLDHQQNLNWGGNTGYTWSFPINNTQAYSSYRWDIVPTAESPQGWIVEIRNLQLFDSGSGEQPVNRPPVAAFTPSSTSVLTGEVVTFDAAASFDPDNYALAYFWDFGDGQTAHTYQPVVQHIYRSLGMKNVVLTVRDSLGGMHSAQQTVSITAAPNAPPIASFTATPMQLDKAGYVQFDASASSDPANGDLTYQWEFGDNGKGTGADVQHLFPSGVYTTTLTVTNEQGLRAMTTRIIEVLPESLPSSIGINFSSNSAFLYPSEYAGFIPARNWNSMGSTGSLNSLQDNLGNPTSASVTTDAGSRYGFSSAPLTSPNDRLLGGQVGHLSRNTIITSVSSIPYSLYDVYVYWGGRLAGTMAVSDGTETLFMRDTDLTWDGVLSESIATTAGQALDGNEFVVFRGRTGSGITITTVGPGTRTGPAAIHVVDRTGSANNPVALFTASPASGTAPLSVNFNASASFAPSPIVEYRWDWESDGTVDQVTTSAQIHHVFTVGGIYNVMLTVVDDEGRTGSASIQLNIAPPLTAPVAVINASQLSGEAPLIVEFDGNDSYDQNGGTIVAYRWDWNSDGVIDATGPTVTHTLSQGSHNVRLTVEDNDGEIASTTVVVQVTAPILSSVFSLNFGSNEMSSEQVAGVLAAANWNNVPSTGSSGLKDATGQVTPVTVSPTGGSSYSTADDPNLSGDHRMMSTYRGTQSASISFSVSNLPNSFAVGTYDVLVYFGGNSSSVNFTPKYTIGTTSYILRDTTDTWSGLHTRSTSTNAATAETGHSYVRFEGLSGASFQILIERNGAQRYGISGMQIILNPSDPEPELNPYQQWLASNGISQEDNSAPDASLMNDGIPNLLKYAVGIAPNAPLPEALRPTLQEEVVGPDSYVGLTFRLNPSRTDVHWQVLQSPDLQNWFPASDTYAAPIDHSDGTRSWFIRSSTSPSAGPVFLRLQLEYVAP